MTSLLARIDEVLGTPPLASGEQAQEGILGAIDLALEQPSDRENAVEQSMLDSITELQTRQDKRYVTAPDTSESEDMGRTYAEMPTDSPYRKMMGDIPYQEAGSIPTLTKQGLYDEKRSAVGLPPKPLPGPKGTSDIPFLTTNLIAGVGAYRNAKDLYNVLDASRRIQKGTETITDWEVIADYQKALVEESRGTTFLAGAKQMLAESIPFMQEFALSGGVVAIGKKAVVKGGKKILGKKIAAQVGKRIAQFVKIPGGKLIPDAAARTFLLDRFSYRVDAGTVQRMIPEGVAMPTDKAGEYKFVVANEGEDFETARKNARVDTVIEVWSEGTGKSASKLVAIVTGPIKRELGLAPLRVGAREVLEKLGYHGIIEEIMEEDIGKAMREAVTRIGAADLPQEFTTPTEYGQMGLAFSVPALAGQALGRERKAPVVPPTLEEEMQGAALMEEMQGVQDLTASPGVTGVNKEGWDSLITSHEQRKQAGQKSPVPSIPEWEAAGVPKGEVPTISKRQKLIEDEIQRREQVSDATVTQEDAGPDQEAGVTEEVLEPAADKGRTTSVKNAVVDQERAERGLPPAMEPARQAFADVWDEAMRIADTGPSRMDVLLDKWETEPVSATPVESALLLHRQIELQNEYAKIVQLLEESQQAQDDAVIASLEDQEASLLKRLEQVYDIGKKVGTEAGRSLNIRKMLAAEDFSLVKMLNDKRKSMGVGQLSTQDEVATKAQYRKIAELEQKLTEHTQRIEQLEAEKASIAAVKAIQIEAPKVDPQKRTIKAKAEVESAWKNLEGILSDKLFANPLDPEVLSAMTKVATAYVKMGVASFKDFLSAVKTRLGETKVVKLEDTLRAAWTAANETSKPTTRSTLEKPEAVSRFAQKLAKFFVADGITEREALIDAVHGELLQRLPEITRRQAMDAISGYGQFSQLSKDEIDVLLRDLKGQMQQLGKLDDMASGKAPVKTGWEQRLPSEVEVLMIKEVNEAKKEGGYDVTDPATQLKSALAAAKTRMRNRIADYQKRLAEKDFAPRQRKETPFDEEAEKLRYEAEQAKAEFHAALAEDIRKRRTTVRKMEDVGKESLHASRSILTSFDVSAVLRQGGIIVAGHPKLSSDALAIMKEAGMSKAGASKVANQLAQRQNAALYKRARLALTQVGGPLARQEEKFLGRWSEKIPVVAASERAYVSFLNQVRADLFDSMVATLGKGGTVSESEAKVIANYVNVATGRGSLAQFQPAAQGLASVFFAPRYVASRFQYLMGQPLWGGNARTRKLIAKEYARTLMGVGAFYGTAVAALLSMAGPPGEDKDWDIEVDPRSSDFGKIRIGNVRIDPLFGVSQATVFISRLVSGSKKSFTTGKISPIRGEVPFGASNSWDVVTNFLRTKLAPAPSTAVNLLVGKNVIGEDVTPLTTARDLLVPISVREIPKFIEEYGVVAGAGLSALEMLGMTAQYYDPKDLYNLDEDKQSPVRRMSQKPSKKRNETFKSKRKELAIYANRTKLTKGKAIAELRNTYKDKSVRTASGKLTPYGEARRRLIFYWPGK